MQELGSEVGAVRLHDRVKFWIELEGLELLHILEGGKRLSLEFLGQIHKALCAIVELEVDDVLPLVPGFDNMQDHGSISKGSSRTGFGDTSLISRRHARPVLPRKDSSRAIYRVGRSDLLAVSSFS